MHQRAQDQDRQLLANYARNGSEKSFAALVEKYAGIVFNAALRKTGNRQTAEEVTQNVFAILARKAGKLKKESVLAGWLHRTAMFECSHALRKESSRQRKMKALAEQQSIQAEGEPTVPPEAIDAGLAKLPPKDQDILLLRFYEGLSFREIGERIGKSEDASQKHASRALEKLGRILGRPGAVPTATVLAGVLTAEFAKAAPPNFCAGLAKSASAAAPLISKGTLTIHSLETMTYGKLNTCLAVVAIVAATPLAIQQRQLDSARTSLHQLESVTPQRALALSNPLSRNPTTAALGETREPMFGSADDWIAHAITNAESFTEIFERRNEMTKLTAAEQVALLHELERHPGLGKPKSSVINDLLAALEQHSREESLAHAMRLDERGSAARTLVRWAEEQPDAALAWFHQRQAAGVLASAATPDPDQSHESWMVRRLATTLAANDLQKAVEFASTQQGQQARAALGGITVSHLKLGRSKDFSKLTASIDLPADEKNQVIAKAAASTVAELGATSADWVLTHSEPEYVEANIAAVMRTWSDSNAESAEAWIAVLADSSLRDHALRGLAEGFVGTIDYGFRQGFRPGKAKRIAADISDPTLRQQTMDLIEKHIAEQAQKKERDEP